MQIHVSSQPNGLLSCGVANDTNTLKLMSQPGIFYTVNLVPSASGYIDLEIINQLALPMIQAREEHNLWRPSRQAGYTIGTAHTRLDAIVMASMIREWDLPHRIETLLDPGQDYAFMTVTEASMSRLPSAVYDVLLESCLRIFDQCGHTLLDNYMRLIAQIKQRNGDEPCRYSCKTYPVSA